MIRHILLVHLKPDTSAESLAAVKEGFLAIPKKIDGVVGVEWGINDSEEGLNKEYTLGVLMTFADEKARQNYLPHPEHEKLKKVFVSIIQDIVVFDYTVER